MEGLFRAYWSRNNVPRVSPLPSHVSPLNGGPISRKNGPLPSFFQPQERPASQSNRYRHRLPHFTSPSSPLRGEIRGLPIHSIKHPVLPSLSSFFSSFTPPLAPTQYDSGGFLASFSFPAKGKKGPILSRPERFSDRRYVVLSRTWSTGRRAPLNPRPPSANTPSPFFSTHYNG